MSIIRIITPFEKSEHGDDIDQPANHFIVLSQIHIQFEG
jgi:hypothetical protein